MAKYSEKEKKAYLKYFNKNFPVRGAETQPFGLWRKAGKTGGSVQTKKQMRGLSASDMKELQKRFGRK